MRTRRRYLATLGTLGLGALAGCETLEGPDESPDRIERADLSGWTPREIQPPRTLPVALPEERTDVHRDRMREFLDMVPAEPSIPNEVIEDRLRDERARLATRVEKERDSPSLLAALGEWRWYRRKAANLYGQYATASGEDLGDTLEDRRQELREQLGEERASIEYSAGSPVEAILVYERVESLLEDADRYLRPHDPYPEHPVANVEQAGAAVGSVEGAAAALADARWIRESALAPPQAPSSHWSTLLEAVRGLEITVDRTRRERIPNPAEANVEEVFSGELSGVDRELFKLGRRRARSGDDPVRGYRESGQVASAVLEAGRQLSGIVAFDAIISALEADERDSDEAAEMDDGQSVAALKRASASAADRLESLRSAQHPHLTSAIADPAIGAYRAPRRYLEDQYFDPERAEASFRYAALYGTAAPDVASFVAGRLEEG